MKKTLLSVLIVAVVVGSGAFYGGMKYAQSTRQNPALFQKERGLGGQQSGAANLGGLGSGRSGAGGVGFTAGEIIAKDNSSVTVKLNNGGSKIIFYSNTTEVDKFAKGTANDLQIGESVIVNGDANQDGSVTAKSIQIRPAMPAPAGQ